VLLGGLLAGGEGAAIDILEQRGVNPAAVRSRTLQIARGQAPSVAAYVVD